MVRDFEGDTQRNEVSTTALVEASYLGEKHPMAGKQDGLQRSLTVAWVALVGERY